MPKLGGLYCRMDDMCLGVECCVTIELLEMFQKTFRGYARFDLYDLALKLGFESWEYSFDFKKLIPGMFVDYSKTCLKWPLKKRQSKDLIDKG